MSVQETKPTSMSELVSDIKAAVIQLADGHNYPDLIAALDALDAFVWQQQSAPPALGDALRWAKAGESHGSITFGPESLKKFYEILTGPMQAGSVAQPVHQWRRRIQGGAWTDAPERVAYVRVDANYEARTLFTAPPSMEQVIAAALKKAACIARDYPSSPAVGKAIAEKIESVVAGGHLR
jgi:predicted transcriptional regulator